MISVIKYSCSAPLNEVHIYDGSKGTSAGFLLEMLMEIGFQEVVNEGGYDAPLEKQGLMESSLTATIEFATSSHVSP